MKVCYLEVVITKPWIELSLKKFDDITEWYNISDEYRVYELDEFIEMIRDVC